MFQSIIRRKYEPPAPNQELMLHAVSRSGLRADSAKAECEVREIGLLKGKERRLKSMVTELVEVPSNGRQ